MNLVQALRFFRGVIIALAIILPLVMLQHVQCTEDFILVLGGVAMMLICSIPVFIRKDYNILEPLTIMILLVIQGITVKICLVVAFQDLPAVSRFLLTGHDPTFLLKGVWVMLIGYIGVAVGYMLPAPILKSRRFLFLNDRIVWNQKRFYYVIGGVLIISTIAFLLFVNSIGLNLSNMFDNASAKRFNNLEGADGGKGANQRLQFVGYYFYRIAHFARYAFYIAFAFVISTNKKLFSFSWLMVAVSFSVSIFLVYFTSDRSGMGWLILEAVFILILLRKKFNFGYVLIIPALLVVSSAVILAQRTEKRAEQSASDILISTFGGRDMIDFTKTCQIIDHVPKTMPYEYGKSLYGWIFAPIPKSVWPDKPLFMEQGNVIAIKIYGQSGVTGVYPGMPAELYWNFDIFGVWLGLLFFTWGQRLMYVNFKKSESTPASVIVYVILLTHFTVFTFGHSWGFGVLKIILNIVPINIALFLITKRPRFGSGPSLPQ